MPDFYAQPNAGFLQNESGDDQVLLEDLSGSIATLQTAINQARSDYPGAFVLIRLKPGALYSVSTSPLVLGSKMCLTGNATRIEATGANATASSLIQITPGSSFVSISNVILNGRLAAVRGIQALNVSRVNIDNLVVRNTGRAGIFLQGPGVDVFDSQLSVANCDLASAASSSGIYLKDAAQAVCIENISAANENGISLESVSRAAIANNRCAGNSGSGIALLGNSTASNVFNNLVTGSPTAISLGTSTVRNTIASNEIRSATTGIALDGVVHTLHDNIFPSSVATPVQTATTGHNIVTTAAGFATTGQNYFYPPTILNNHSATVIAGKANTVVATSATTFSQVQAAYDAARAANPANTIILRLTAPVITGDTTLALSSNTSVVINGRVNLAPGVAGFTSENSTFVSISGGIIDGGNSTGRQGIEFAGCSRVLIDRVTLQNFGDKNTRVTDSDLIRFSKGGSACIVAHCTLNGGAARGIWTVDATARFLFTDNTISNVNMDGIDLDAFTNSALVKFNSVSGCVRNGIFVEEGAKHNQVVGNVVASNPIAINLYAYDVDLTSYNSIIANTCTSNGRGIRVGARSTMNTEHNFIFGNKITQTGPQSALDAQLYGPENYFSQNQLLNNADDIGSSSAVFFNSPSMAMPAQPLVFPAAFTGAVGFAFSGRIDATGLPTRFTRVSGAMPQGLVLNAITGQISGTPMQSGNYLIGVTATNLRGTSSAQNIPITITANLSTAKPVLTSAASVNANVAQAFTHQITATNLPTFYSAVGLMPGLSINAATGLISGTPPSEGTFATRIFATNPGGTGNQTLTFTIAPTLPVITSPANAAGHAGSPFRYRIVASNYSRTFGATGLPSGLSVNSTSGLISGTPAAIGNATVTLSATNGAGTATKILQLAIHRPPPVLTSNSSATGKVGDPLAHQLAATNNPVTFASSRLPSGLTLNATTGMISGKPGSDGSFAVLITATNPGGTGNQTLTFTIAPTLPVITSLDSAIATVGAAFTYSITASNRPRTYAASGLPTGLTVNATTGLISGIPTAVGNATITLSAANGAGTATKILQLAIRPQPPAITSNASATGKVGNALAHQLTATNTPTFFSASGLPTGLTINATTGWIIGTPTIDGVFAAFVSAANSGGVRGQTLTFTISPTLPVITSPANAAGNAGMPFRYRIAATNYARTFGATGLPSGLSVNATSGVISGTPVAIGNATVTLSAANGAGTATKILQLAIHPPPPVFTSNASATGKVGDALTHQLAATNNPSTFAAWRLPSGLTLNSTTGLISGKPGIDGAFAVLINATNSGGTGNQTLTFTIAPTLPVITSLESAIATVGTAFNYSITASNRPRTYDATGLPSGLSANSTTGLVSGIPTTAGNATVTLSAANGAGTATKILQLAIRPQPPAITSAASTSGRVGVSFSYQITASNSPTRFSASGLPSGLTLNATTGLISGSPTLAGSFGTRVVAINAGGAGNQTVSIAVSNP